MYAYKRNTVELSRNHCCRGKAICITYSECVSIALVIKHVKRTRPITRIVSSLASLVLPRYLINSKIFGSNVISYTMCIFISSTVFA
jgi:hypothetical protein